MDLRVELHARRAAGMRPAPGSAWAIVLAAAVASLTLAGCGGGDAKKTPVAAASTATEDEPVDLAVEEARRSLLGAITVGSPAAPIDLRYALKGVPIVGRPFDVEFAVFPEATIVTLEAHFDGTREGLEIAAPADGVSLEKLQAGTVQRFNATVVPHSSGAHVLAVELAIELPTGPAKRLFSIPLVVQTPAAAAANAAAAGRS